MFGLKKKIWHFIEERVSRQFQAKRAALEIEYEQSMKDKEAQLEKLLAKKDVEVKQAEEQLIKAVTSHKEEITACKQRHKEVMDELKMEQDQEILKLNLDHEEQIEQLHINHGKQCDILNHQIGLSMRKKNDEIATNGELTIKLEGANNDLKQQIKLIEAKASPDGVFIEAFSLGASKTWDMIAGVVGDGFIKSKDLLVSRIRDEERATVTKLVDERISVLGSKSLRLAADIEAKIKEFENKKSLTKDRGEIVKYEGYIATLRWVQNEKTN